MNYPDLLKFFKSRAISAICPMVIVIAAGIYFIEKAQRVKFQAREEKYNNKVLKELSMVDRIDFHRELRKLEKLDLSDYKNIRGPRIYEDDTQFQEALKEQQERARRLRAQASVVE